MDDRFVAGDTIRADAVTGRLFPGVDAGPRPGVLVCHGAGGYGGYEQTYAALLAEHGYTTLCVAYFDGPDVPEALHEIPLETFRDAADWLAGRADVAGDQVTVLGFSRGGEAALLTGAHFAVASVVAYVPSGLVFPAPSWQPGVGPGEPAWTLGGDPVTPLPVDEHVEESDDVDDPLGTEPPNAATLAIERSSAAEKAAATVPVERIDAPVLLISGGRDTVWPSSDLADRVVARLETHDHPHAVEHRSYPEAGHAIRVPYRHDPTDDPTATHRFGGTIAANARASADAWQAILAHLDRHA
ncbi:acyl-CoA thioester hydrolase/BAAT C-terminal domain-containing protein [Halobacteriales archaeon Cl-PHB]